MAVLAYRNRRENQKHEEKEKPLPRVKHPSKQKTSVLPHQQKQLNNVKHHPKKEHQRNKTSQRTYQIHQVYHPRLIQKQIQMIKSNNNITIIIK